MNATKPCPTRGCGALIRIECAVCSECWHRLPRDFKRVGFFSEASCWPEHSYRDAMAFLNRLPPLPTQHLEAGG